MFPLWLVGCLISLGGGVGAVLALPVAERRVYFKQRLWLCGLILVVIGGLTDFVSLALAPQSTIAALGSVPLTANIFLAHAWLGEPIGKREVIGTALIVVGSTISIVFGDHSDPDYSASELQHLYGQLPYIIYGGVMILVLSTMYALCRWKLTPMRYRLVDAIEALNELQLASAVEVTSEETPLEQSTSPPPPLSSQEHHHSSLSSSQILTAAAAGVAADEILSTSMLPPVHALKTPVPRSHREELQWPLLEPVASLSDYGTSVASPTDSADASSQSANAHITSVAVSGPTSDDQEAELAAALELVSSLESAYSTWSRVHPVCYCAIAGTFGAQSLLFGKSVAELTSMTLSGDNQLQYGLTYVFLGALGTCIIGQLHFFAAALEFFDALYVVPVFKCFFLMLSTIGGALYFSEFDEFSKLQWSIFPFGLALNIVGVYVLSMRDMSVRGRGQDGGEEDEDSSISSCEVADAQLIGSSSLEVSCMEEHLLPGAGSWVSPDSLASLAPNMASSGGAAWVIDPAVDAALYPPVAIISAPTAAAGPLATNEASRFGVFSVPPPAFLRATSPPLLAESGMASPLSVLPLARANSAQPHRSKLPPTTDMLSHHRRRSATYSRLHMSSRGSSWSASAHASGAASPLARVASYLSPAGSEHATFAVRSPVTHKEYRVPFDSERQHHHHRRSTGPSGVVSPARHATPAPMRFTAAPRTQPATDGEVAPTYVPAAFVSQPFVPAASAAFDADATAHAQELQEPPL